MVAREVQPQNVPSWIEVTPFGMTMLSRELHFSNALRPIEVILADSETLARDVHL